MIRFFVQPSQLNDGRVTLSGQDAHHLRAVLQAKAGDTIAILDGSGREWPAVLEEAGKTRAVARLREPIYPGTEPTVQITVAQALPKMAEKLEQVLQRSTEIGASRFVIFESERSVSALNGDRQAKKSTRWMEIVKTAAEQSHRAQLPSVEGPITFPDVLSLAQAYDAALLLHAGHGRTYLPSAIAGNPRSLLLLVGPESGFSDNEVTLARAAGVHIVSLGPRVLRTETAAMVAVSQIIYALEAPAVC